MVQKVSGASRLLGEIACKNGLMVLFSDESRHYFGDYHRVRLIVSTGIPVTEEHLPEGMSIAEVRALLGESVHYRRVMEQHGVPSARIDGVLEELVANFRQNSLPYLSSPIFPRKMIQAELGKKKRARSTPPVLNLHHE